MRFRRNKHNARSVRLDGIYFPSTGEAERYKELKLLDQAKEISGLKVHPRYPIVVHCSGEKRGSTEVCFVVLDFEYYDKKLKRVIYEDFKPGVYTGESRLRHKLFTAYYGDEIFLSKKGGAAR